MSADNDKFLEKYFKDNFNDSDMFKKVIHPSNKIDCKVATLLEEKIGFNPLNLFTVLHIGEFYIHVASVFENFHQTNYYKKQTVDEYDESQKDFANTYRMFVKKVNTEILNEEQDIKKPYCVKNWMVSEISEFSNYGDAKKRYDELNNGEEIDIQLYKLLYEHNNVD